MLDTTTLQKQAIQLQPDKQTNKQNQKTPKPPNKNNKNI